MVNYYDNSGNSNYHALEVLATRSFRNGYSFQVAYTLAKSIDNVSDGLSDMPNDSANIQDPTNLRNNRGVSGFDVPQRIVVTACVGDALGQEPAANPVLRRMVAGWGLSRHLELARGLPDLFRCRRAAGRGQHLHPPHRRHHAAQRLRPGDVQSAPAGSAGRAPGAERRPGRRRAASPPTPRASGLSQPLLGNFGAIGRNTHRANGQADFDWNVYQEHPRSPSA